MSMTEAELEAANDQAAVDGACMADTVIKMFQTVFPEANFAASLNCVGTVMEQLFMNALDQVAERGEDATTILQDFDGLTAYIRERLVERMAQNKAKLS